MLRDALQVQADPADLQAGRQGRNDLQLLLSQEKKTDFLRKKKILKNFKIPIKMPTSKCSLNCEFSK